MESVNDECRYGTFSYDEWNIERIYFDEDKDIYFEVDEATKLPHLILLYLLKIMGPGDSTEHVTSQNNFHFGGLHRVLAYIKVDRFCHGRPGRVLKMSFSRARAFKSSARQCVLQFSATVKFRDASDSCMQGALCNAIHILGHTDLAEPLLDVV